jgi:hypothetical protein
MAFQSSRSAQKSGDLPKNSFHSFFFKEIIFGIITLLSKLAYTAHGERVAPFLMNDSLREGTVLSPYEKLSKGKVRTMSGINAHPSTSSG